MHKMTCKITFWLLPLAMAAVSLPLSAAEVRLASGGVTDYTIMGPAKPSRDEAAATNDLREFLTRITGAQFTVGGDARHRIHIGRKAPGDTAPLKPFERRVREEGGDVYIYGNGCSGNAFAVYDFLEKFFNCRWYTFFGDMSIPEKREAVFPSLMLDVVPSFDSFCYFGNLYTQRTTHGEDFRRRSRIYDYRLPEGTPVPRLGSNYPHVPSRYLPSGLVKPGTDSPVYGPYKYFEDKAYFKTNPEFYSLSRGGTRDWTYHLCYSNKEMRRELIKNYLEIVKNEYKGGPALMLADLNDKGKAGMPLCWCPECTKLNEAYGNTAGCYWDFILEICQVFKEKYPEILLQAPVYQLTRSVPEKMQGKLPDNLLLRFAPLDETDFLKPYEPYAPAACDMFESWRSITDGKLAVTLYPTVYPRPLWTHPLVANIDRLVRNLRYLHRRGVNELAAEFGCGACGEMGFNELRVYLLACLARDVEADVPALIRDFMEHYYGAAAQAMMQYLAELEQCEKNEANFMRWWPDHRSVLQYLTPENLLKWQGDFDRMEQLTAGDEKANMHVRRARTNLDEATLSVWYKFQDGQMPDRELMRSRHRKTKQDSYSDMLATYEPAEERKTYVDRCVSWTDRSMYYHYAMAGEWKPLPEEFAQLPAGQLKRIVPCINNRRIPEDAEAATGLAVKGELPEKFSLRIYRWDAPPVEVRNAFKERLMPAEVQKAAGRGYQMYYIGTSRLWPDSMLSFNIGGGMVTLGYLWDAGSPEQKYDFHLSLKLEDDGRTLWCGELVLVKSDKPSTLEDRNRYPGTVPRVYNKRKILRRK